MWCEGAERAPLGVGAGPPGRLRLASAGSLTVPCRCGSGRPPSAPHARIGQFRTARSKPAQPRASVPRHNRRTARTVDSCQPGGAATCSSRCPCSFTWCVQSSRGLGRSLSCVLAALVLVHREAVPPSRRNEQPRRSHRRLAQRLRRMPPGAEWSARTRRRSLELYRADHDR